MPSTAARNQIIAWILVAIQAGLIAATVLTPRDAAWGESPVLTAMANSLVAVAVVLGTWAALHLGRGLTPVPLPNGAVELVTKGPYRWIRHPIYTAVIAGMAGIAIRTYTPLVLGFAISLALFLAFKARWEETHLRRAFDGYATYAAATGRFLPGIGRIPDPAGAGPD